MSPAQQLRSVSPRRVLTSNARKVLGSIIGCDEVRVHRHCLATCRKVRASSDRPELMKFLINLTTISLISLQGGALEER